MVVNNPLILIRHLFLFLGDIGGIPLDSHENLSYALYVGRVDSLVDDWYRLYIRLPLYDHLIKFGMTILRILFSPFMVTLCIWATGFSIETRLVDKGFSIRFL